MSEFGLPHKRGVAIRGLYGTTIMVVLGGPTVLAGRKHYTCMALVEALLDMQPHRAGIVKIEPGQNYVIPEEYLSAHRGSLEWTDTAIGFAQQAFKEDRMPDAYGEVIEKWCPNCEIDDMIWYSEDYICAWCREMIER